MARWIDLVTVLSDRDEVEQAKLKDRKLKDRGNQHWFVYMILTSDNSYYTGITTDIARRWHEHLGVALYNQTKGAKFFRSRNPKRLVYLEGGHNRSTAGKREAAIKSKPHTSKKMLVQSTENEIDKFFTELIDSLVPC